MPSTTFSTVSMAWFSSIWMTPSLPTFSIASASMSPMARSPLALMVPTWAISALSLVGLENSFSAATTFSTAASTPRFRSMGLCPAATRRAPSL